jgi:hypothetical protein
LRSSTCWRSALDPRKPRNSLGIELGAALGLPLGI